MMLNPRMNDNIGHAAHLGGAFSDWFMLLLFTLSLQCKMRFI
jgi:hypothetical protein